MSQSGFQNDLIMRVFSRLWKIPFGIDTLKSMGILPHIGTVLYQKELPYVYRYRCKQTKEILTLANIIPVKSKKGFTLIELVVVIAILAILAAIAIPVVNLLLNAAAKSTALANAQSIELGVKECQGYIATKNDEVYNGGELLGMEIPKASTQHGMINIGHVAKIKGIETAFAVVDMNGVSYLPYWDTVTEKCVFLGKKDGSGYHTINGDEISDSVGVWVDSRYIALLVEQGEKMVINSSLKIDWL